MVTKRAAGGISASAVALIAAALVQYEGVRHVGYLDPAGIPTKCMGDTHDVVVGKYYRDAECLKSLMTQVTSHGDAVLSCVPSLAGHDNQIEASTRFAYNIGSGAFCKSTVAKRFNRGDWRGACRAINQDDRGNPQWVTAVVSWQAGAPRPYPKYRVRGESWTYTSHGTVFMAANIEFPGLVKRRAAERALCEKGL